MMPARALGVVAAAALGAACEPSRWTPVPEVVASASAVRPPDPIPPSLSPSLPPGLGSGDVAWLNDDTLVAVSAEDGSLYWWRVGDAAWVARGTLGCGADGLLKISLRATRRGLVWSGFDRGRDRHVSGLSSLDARRGCRALAEPADPWGRPTRFGGSGSFNGNGDFVELAVGSGGPLRFPPIGGPPVPLFRVWRAWDRDSSARAERSESTYTPPPAGTDSAGLFQYVHEALSVVRWLAPDTVMVVSILRAEGQRWVAVNGTWRALPGRVRFPLHADSYRPIIVPRTSQQEWGDILSARSLSGLARDRRGRWWIVSSGPRLGTVGSLPWWMSNHHGLAVWHETHGECRWFFDASATGINILSAKVSPSGGHVAVTLWNKRLSSIDVAVWDASRMGC